MPVPTHKKRIILNLFLYTVVAVMAGVWVYDMPFESRLVNLRYLLLGVSGFIAFVTPYILFPDKRAKLLQLGNVRGRDLLFYQFGKTAPLYFSLLLFVGVLMLFDSSQPRENLLQKLLYTFYGVLFISGLNLMALYRYSKSGAQSQFWQESERGRELRGRIAEYFKYPLDPGAIPSLLNTLLITFTGMAWVVTASLLEQGFGIYAELAAGLLLFAGGVRYYFFSSRDTERNYYQTNSFFGEFFGVDLDADSITARREVEQLWWVPSPWRAGVWQFLQQIDRKVPAGRAVAAGHLFVWLIAYQNPDELFMTGIWALFAVAHHLFILMTLQQEMAPSWLLRWQGSVIYWFFIRIWMQVRWLLPLVVSMNLQLFLFGIPGWQEQFFVVIIYLASASFVSMLGTLQLKKSIH